ncbi:hypothetical protein RDV78_06115 [Bacillota bacterium LX-D]|nr:hypothetical protein [Bacillota bacterium LX-D]
MEINLLPAELRSSSLPNSFYFIGKITVGILLLITLLTYLIFKGFNYVLQSKNMEISQKLDQNQIIYRQINIIKGEIAEHEKEIKEYESILEQKNYWNKIFCTINNKKPSTVSLTKLQVQGNNKLLIRGTTSKLTTIGAFIYQLSKIEFCNKVNLNIATTSLEKNTNIEFEIIVDLKEDVV